MSEIPPSEHQIASVLQSLFATEYALERKDQNTMRRLMRYGEEMNGLTLKEKVTLRSRGLMDADNKFKIPEEFFFRGLILPSYWMKCLMALHKMLSFGDENEETPQ